MEHCKIHHLACTLTSLTSRFARNIYIRTYIHTYLHRDEHAVRVEVLWYVLQHSLVSQDVEGIGMPVSELRGEGVHHQPVSRVSGQGGERAGGLGH